MVKLRAVVLTGGVVAGIALAAAPASALGPLHHQTLRVTVAGKVTSLVVRGEVGDIKVVSGATTRIVAIEQYNLSAPQFTHSLSDGVLHVSAPCPREGVISLGLNNCAVDFVITVPHEVAVDAVDEVGDVSVRGLQGNDSVHTDVGEVNLAGVSAPTLSATTSAGTVRLIGVAANTVNLRNDTGGIQAELTDAPRSLIARSSDGDVDLTVPSGDYALHLHTDIGSAHVTGVTEQADAPRTVTATSDDGDVRITGK